jgi:hypothetical protein
VYDALLRHDERASSWRRFGDDWFCMVTKRLLLTKAGGRRRTFALSPLSPAGMLATVNLLVDFSFVLGVPGHHRIGHHQIPAQPII